MQRRVPPPLCLSLFESWTVTKLNGWPCAFEEGSAWRFFENGECRISTGGWAHSNFNCPGNAELRRRRRRRNFSRALYHLWGAEKKARDSFGPFLAFYIYEAHRILLTRLSLSALTNCFQASTLLLSLRLYILSHFIRSHSYLELSEALTHIWPSPPTPVSSLARVNDIVRMKTRSNPSRRNPITIVTPLRRLNSIVPWREKDTCTSAWSTAKLPRRKKLLPVDFQYSLRGHPRLYARLILVR